MKQKRKPQISPGPANNTSELGDDFTLVPALYFDAIRHYESATLAKEQGGMHECDRFKRSAVLAAFAFFEAQLNQVAFGYAEAHQDLLGQIERDVLEEMETTLTASGEIMRKKKFYSTESRFCFLTLFLTGSHFDRSGDLWQRFKNARRIRDTWTHPKPPFDTWSLGLNEVRETIEVVRDMYVKLSEMMKTNPPLWLRPINEVRN